MTAIYNTSSEEAFQRSVIELAGWLGWKVHAERPARTQSGWITPIQGDPGWPDLVLVKGSRCIVAELKSAKGRTTIDQDDWLKAFRAIPGIEVHVFRPKDAELIERILKKGPPCSCGNTGWTEDKSWQPEPWEMKRGRIPGSGLIPCGFCNLGGWDAPFEVEGVPI